MNTLCNKAHKAFSTLLSVFLIIIIFSFKTVSAQPDGAKLFKQNCAACHRLDDKALTGPGLQGIFQRVPQPADEWLLKWIKNNDKLIKSGDAYAVKISNFSPANMNSFEFLPDEDINAIIAYIKAPPAAPVAGPTTAPTTAPAPAPEGIDPTWILVAIILFLLVVIGVLRGVKKSLKNVVNEKQGLPAEADRTWWGDILFWMVSHKTMVAVILIVLISVGSKAAWDWMFNIGVYTGYKPSQPIAFSHKIHAGDNAINCVYCHSTAEKSRHASIPSVSTCMNCHKGIESGAITGKTEIAKIYEAAGWNPEIQAYSKPQKPLVWNKVHNLPDFVYFSHEQHVTVGKQECQTCHGDVASMTVAEQFSPLTMRWCIDCHRTTEVPGIAIDNNPYYADLHKTLAKKYKGQKITVDKIGGIECARCHY